MLKARTRFLNLRDEAGPAVGCPGRARDRLQNDFALCERRLEVMAAGGRSPYNCASQFPSQRLGRRPMSDVTRILSAIQQGDPDAAAALLPLVYEELRRLAAQRLAQEKPGQTLQPTALVHEAYLRLVGADPAQPWNSRGHFFAAAAEAMRRILIDQARRKRCPKHGGDRHRVDLGDVPAVAEPHDDLLALDEALTRLAAEEPAKAELVRLRYFAGLSLEETAACLGISPTTAKRRWAVARAWLFAALSEGDATSG
jgi:RNA polymerase sigma factor (TIGR02999 family)